MAEVSIASVIDDLEGKLVKTRDRGLDDLRKLLSGPRSGNRLNDLKEDGFHKILESIYRMVRTDRSNYINALASGKTVITHRNRLSSAATALRLSVESRCSTLNQKSVQSVLDHIVSTLVTADDTFVDPLTSDYLKCFRTVLEYAPHVEHLRPKKWQELVDFLLFGISLSTGHNEPNSSSASHENGAARSTMSVSFRASQASTQRSSRASHGNVIDDLLGSLCALSSVSNMPLITRATEISQHVIYCLTNIPRGQELALGTFNNLTYVLLSENLSLLQSNFQALIRTYRHMWSSKSTALREQILISLYALRPLLLAKSSALAFVSDEEKQQLLSTLFKEYAGRQLRDLLQWDDIVLPLCGEASAGGPSYMLRPSGESGVANANWTLLQVIATLATSLGASNTEAFDDSEIQDVPRKRRKLDNPVVDTVQHALYSHGSQKIAAIQVLFSLSLGSISVVQSLDLQDLLPLLLEEDQIVSSWAMLLFVQLVWAHNAEKYLSADMQRSLTGAARRALPISGKSRAACLLMDSLLNRSPHYAPSEMRALCDIFVSHTRQGPAILTDASLLMFTRAFRVALFDSESTLEAAAARTLEWLAARWTLPATLDRVYNAHLATHVQPEYLCELMAAIIGCHLDPRITYYETGISIVGNGRALVDNIEPYVTYLQLTDKTSDQDLGPVPRRTRRQWSSGTTFRLQSAIATLCLDKVNDFKLTWESYTASRLTGSSNDLASIIVTTTITAHIASSILLHIPARESLKESASGLWSLIENSLRKAIEVSSRISAISARVLRIRDSPSGGSNSIARALQRYHVFMSQAIRDCTHGNFERNGADEDVDMMDPLDSHVSQRSRLSTESEDKAFGRRVLLADSAPLLTLACLRLDMLIEAGKCSPRKSDGTTESIEIVAEIANMDGQSLVDARSAILNFLNASPPLTRADAASILKAMASGWLQAHEFERNEVSLCLLTQVMASLAPLWADPKEDDQLTGLASDVYIWLTGTILAKNAASPSLKLNIAIMLDRAGTIPASVADETLPSPRTTLLGILNDSPNYIKFSLAPLLNRLFDRYILTQHAAIFDDIIDHLPSDLNNTEGVAVRFYLLATLGGKWYTVLRQVTYHLFETAVNAPKMRLLGGFCVQKMSSALGLSDSRKLFALFAPQVLYTWLGIGSILSLPYQIFNYDSLEQMLAENESEVVAQIALRGGQSHVADFTNIRGITWQQALNDHFGQVEAYCLASQISLPESEQLYPNSETALRKEMGIEAYAKALELNLPVIAAHLFRIVQDDRGIERSLEKSGSQDSLKDLRHLSQLSASTTELPPGQQPFFRAKFLVNELEWLCKQTGHSLEEIWVPTVLVQLYRTLLMSADPALGALTACSALRKLKVVVSLGGVNTTRGYALEMLLHNLRPYLTIFQCSEDAIGIYWFLLEKSRQYLSSRPSFLVSLAVTIFAALTRFVKSSQDSTTQESHFVATMTQAQKFRAWFGQYLVSLKLHDDNHQEWFQEIVQHLGDITGPCSNATGTHEGAVLMCLLKDRAKSTPVLSESHFDLALHAICEDFAPATDSSQDILLAPADCHQYANVIADVLRRLELGNNFNIWAAQIIGRACSWNGPHFDSRVSDQSLDNSSSRNSLTETDSYIELIRILESAVWQAKLEVAAAAEKSLQSISDHLSISQDEALLTAGAKSTILKDLQVISLPSFRSNQSTEDILPLPKAPHQHDQIKASQWCSGTLLAICSHAKSNAVLQIIGSFATRAPFLASRLLPYVLHLALLNKDSDLHSLRTSMSGIWSQLLEESHNLEIVPVALASILYLRRCRLPTEHTIAQRNMWLDVDFGKAATAAVRCQLWNTALLCVEIQQAQQHVTVSRSSRRSTQSGFAVVPACISAIYESVDDPDFFYAGHEDSNMQSIIQRLAHESASQKMLGFQSAILDAMQRAGTSDDYLQSFATTTANTLSLANMQSISDAVKSFHPELSGKHTDTATGRVVHTEWNLVPRKESARSLAPTSYVDSLATTSQLATVMDDIDSGMLIGAEKAVSPGMGRLLSTARILNMAMLSEAKDVLSMSKTYDSDSILEIMGRIQDWAQRLDFDDLSLYLDFRELVFGGIRRNNEVSDALGVPASQALIDEAKCIRQSLQHVVHHNSSQFQLTRAAYLAQLAEVGKDVGVDIETYSQFYLAKTISHHGEISAAVHILRALKQQKTAVGKAEEKLSISTSEIMAELGLQVSSARLETPDEIIANYLIPAYKELHGQTTGSDAGRVFHLFASFCDTQLQDAGNLEDYTQALEKRNAKKAEVIELQRQLKADPEAKANIEYYKKRAISWLQIYEEEYQQKLGNRDSLILRCLENYLRSMSACDDFANDKLRFLAIWLSAADSPKANEVVSDFIQTAPTWKFASLVNQLVSRLADRDEAFQEILKDLMFRITSDHPHHSLYQLFAISKSKKTDGDDASVSRHSAATKLTELVLKKSPANGVWIAIHNSAINFVRVAQSKLPEKRTKFNLKQLQYGDKLITSVEGSSRRIPPPAMRIEIRKDKDYSKVPVMVELQSQVSIAGGVSAPKIVTAIASDGSVHKMLLKSGNDDLRQDSIMEQVFEEASGLLSDHRATRQRKLGIRTYKVVPLVTNAGVIEFVQGTIPLHDWILPAHERYFPKDYKPKRCRQEIQDAEKKSIQQRVQAYRNVTANFHPVMRFFFMENFLDPDEWFYKRLNYSRSSAAISILGHVLGLGDRHGHNILLDKNTGEVVHIDLGVAFEAGRILPVPELVPFRLTRDLVDGMGISGVEGVFRRCCNFTLEALREDQESIMTILDVLRHDPLVSWSVSPYRIKKMQEQAEESQADGADRRGGMRAADEPNEADRALGVVREKLGKSLSVEAEVNELIRQATDEKNLALLYCGWGAHA